MGLRYGEYLKLFLLWKSFWQFLFLPEMSKVYNEYDIDIY